jgi:hypothetical protein
MADNNNYNSLEYVTSEAEAGRGQALSDSLAALSHEERVTLLKQMDNLNKQHRERNSSIPDLVIDFGEESRLLDFIPYLNNLGHHNIRSSVRVSSPLISSVASGGIYYESFDPIALDRTTYTKQSSHWTWNQKNIKP